MTTKHKLSLLAGTAIALSATSAFAAPIDAINPGASVAVDNGGTTCAAIDPATTNPYNTGYVLGSTPVVGQSTTVVCTNQDVNQAYNTFDPFDLEIFGGTAPGNIDFGFSSESGTANATYETVTEASQVYDVTVDPAVPIGGLSLAVSPIAGSEAVTDYSYTAQFQTTDQVHHYSTYEVNDGGDGGTDGIGSAASYTQTAGGSFWAESTGTSTFDPLTGDVTYAATVGKEATQNVNGNFVSQFDTVAGTQSATSQTATGFSVTDGTNTITLGTNPDGGYGLSQGTSYVTVNSDNVTIHGGDTSTTAVWNNSGYTQTDSTNGVTFTVDNNGNVQSLGNNTVGGNLQVNGNANVSGFTTTNGIDNTGNIETDTLLVNTTSSFNGLATFNAGINVTGGTTTDSLLVTGNGQVNGDLTVLGTTYTNGQVNTGNITTDSLTVNNNASVGGDLSVTGYSYTNGIQNNGNVQTDSLTVNNNASVGGDLNVSGWSYINGLTNYGATYNSGTVTNYSWEETYGNVYNYADTYTSGTTTNYGLTNTNGISNSGNISTTTLNTSGNASVGGNLATTGNSSVGGTLAVTGATTLTGLLTANGGVNTTNLAASGNASVGGNLAVTGNSTIGGNETVTGTITGGALVSVGTTTVGTNLTVNGTSNLLGAITNTGTANGGAVYVNDALTVNGPVTVGTIVASNTTNKISGLANATLSSTSTEAVTGQQLFATNTALTALDAREAAHFSLLSQRADKAYQGIAMGFAANAAPLNLDNGEGGISGGVGVFQGQWGGAIRAQYVTDSGVGVGVNFGFSEDAVGGGVGASIKF